MGSLPQPVQDAADISAVSQLILRERLSRDLGLWEQMRDCFHDDSVVRISWINASGPEFVRRSKEMAERNVKASHRLGPIFVTLAGDRAIAELAAMVDIPFTLKGTPKADIDAYSWNVRFVPKADISTSVSLSSVRRLLTQSVTRSQKWIRENSFQQGANYRRGPERQFDR